MTLAQQFRPEAMIGAPRDPVGRPAWELRERIARGELDPVEVVQAHLDRLDEVQPTLNAAITVPRERALR
jgi:Asp-tRNA(Asn)/Glu-tRNA(Gln) amidotransferase A subunit family amidase